MKLQVEQLAIDVKKKGKENLASQHEKLKAIIALHKGMLQNIEFHEIFDDVPINTRNTSLGSLKGS